MAAVPGLADLRAPVVLSGHGGRSLPWSFRCPLAAWQNVARVVSAFMGQNGGAGRALKTKYQSERLLVGEIARKIR